MNYENRGSGRDRRPVIIIDGKNYMRTPLDHEEMLPPPSKPSLLVSYSLVFSELCGAALIIAAVTLLAIGAR